MKLSLRWTRIDTIGAGRQCQTAFRRPLSLTAVVSISYTDEIQCAGFMCPEDACTKH
jgi:hypothetical protein